MSLNIWATKPVIKVACVGNSVTYGYGITNRETDSYPSQLQHMLGDGYMVGNFGKSGATLLRKGHRPYFEQEEFRQAMDFAGDIVIIHLGLNDTDPRNWPHYADEFVRDYVALVDSLKSVNPDAKFYIALLSPISHRHPRFCSGTRDWRGQIQELIPNVASLTGATLIDFEKPLLDKPNLLPDGLHPNPEGAGLLAETVYSAITGKHGGLKMPILYTDHMVLPYGKKFQIKGHADAGANINVSIGTQSLHAIADNGGNWSVTVNPLTSKEPYILSITDGNTTLSYSDVAAGRIWLCSGQSNMEFELRNSTTGKEDIPMSTNPDLRLFDMKARWRTDAKEWPESALDSLNRLLYFTDTAWTPSSPKTTARFSAIGYYFGKELQDSLNLPIGLICNAVGGSTTESWIDRTTLENEFPMILNNPATNDFIQPWVRGRASLNIKKSSDPLQRHPYHPAYLFESGIAPLEAFPIDGVIWYQGESNAHNIDAHEVLFGLLLESWNKNWNQNLPFYFVQLSSISRPSWPAFRQSQLDMSILYEYDNVGMVVSSDLGDSLDVHPRNKRPIGHRLAQKALAGVYGNVNAYHIHPMIERAVVNGDSILVYTNYCSIPPSDYSLYTSDGKLPSTFEVAEFEGMYYPAEASLASDGKTINVRIPAQVKNPVLLRYGWQPFTRANVVGTGNLPMSTQKVKIIPAETGIVTSSVKVIIEEMPQIKGSKGYSKGVSAPFAGRYRNYTLVAGGANFPGKPAAEGGKKALYDEVYVLRDGDSRWEQAGKLPYPVAYGASVSTENGVICIGGSTPQGPTDRILLLSLDAKGKLVVKELSRLPEPAEQLCATMYNGNVLIGIPQTTSSNDGREFLIMKEDGTFSTLTTPSPIVIGDQSCLTTVTGDNGKEIVLASGGYLPGEGERKPSTFPTAKVVNLGPYPYIYDRYWVTGISPAGQTATPFEGNKVLFTGGVNPDIFLSALTEPSPDYLKHPAEWYKFNSHLYLLSPESDFIIDLGDYPATARAGAAAVALGDKSFLLINGEIKPGVRTPSIIKITFP